MKSLIESLSHSISQKQTSKPIEEYVKSLSVGLCEVLSIDLALNKV